MRTKVIEADSTDAAAERILDELKEDAGTRRLSSRNNVIYFDGWDGLGASAVLRAVAQRLTTTAIEEAPAGLQFDQIIHVDCSKWESRRALQRAVAEKMDLPAPLMDMFHKQDEDDDFHGIPEGSRTEIMQVLRAMCQRIQDLNRRFLVIFHNGSTEEMYATIICFLLFGYSTNKVLWTFQGRFRLYPMIKVRGAMETSGNTDVLLSATCSQSQSRHGHEFWSTLMREEAAQVVASLDQTAGCISHPSQQVIDSFSYMSKLCYIGHHFRVDYDLATHCWNYMVCDGIIRKQQQQQLQQGGEEESSMSSNFHGDEDNSDDDGRPWQAAQALQREMRLDVGYYRQEDQQSLPHHLVVGTTGSIDSMPHWTSPLYGALLTSSVDPFQVFAELGVLKLSRCNFSSPSSPPFLYYPNMKFLWIDHCHDMVITKDNGALKEDICQCFQRLWVLDIRYTSCDHILSAEVVDLMTQLRELNVEGAQDCDISLLQGRRLPNIRRLRVTKSTVRCSDHSVQDLFSGMNKMELLDFSGNRTMQEFSTSNSCLETVVIIDRCVGTQKFSFRGCAKLKNLLLSGFFEDLRILDMSGTAVKTLDLSAMTARSLDEVILDNCDKLCAILWPPEYKRNRGVPKVHIDSTHSASTSRSGGVNLKDGSTAANKGSSSSSWPMVLVNGARPPSEFNWYISIKDARFLRSFVPSFEFEAHRVHLEISSPRCCPTVNLGGSENEGIKNQAGEEQQVLSNRRQQQPKYNNSSNNNASVCYADVGTIIVEKHLLQGGEGNGDDARTITRTRPCTPPGRRLDSSECYLYAQDQQMKIKAAMDDGGAIATIPSIICDAAYILHVHDSMYNTCIPGSARWTYLQWCRVERCPRLDFIFNTPQLGRGSSTHMCWCLRTFWASQLPKTRFMWDTSKLPLSKIGGRSFEELTLLHLDFCPRIIHVLPFTSSVIGIRYLETLEIVWCGDLRVVFPLLDTNNTGSHQEQQQKPPGAIITTVDFPRLKHIHLHELPKLQSICGHGGRMYAPELETIKIRGCWSLRHLPAVDRDRSSDKVECDCEKEWWDSLEWDRLDGKHQPSLYNPVHSRYYKKKLLRGSVLK